MDVIKKAPYTRTEYYQNYFKHNKKLMAPLKNIMVDPRLAIPVNLMMKACCHWLDIDETYKKEMDTIQDILIVHGYSLLLLDDMEDDGKFRNDVLTSHRVYGLAHTANSTFYIYHCLLIDKVLELNHPQALVEYIEYHSDVVRGQGLDIYYRENCIYPTEEEYLAVAAKKSAAWYVLFGKFIRLFSTTDKDLTTYLLDLGVYSQLQNDYEGFTNTNLQEKEGFLKDIEEGNASFPIIHAIHSDPERGEMIKSILSLRPTDWQLKLKCFNLIKECGSLEYTKTVLMQYTRKLMHESKLLGENPYASAVLKGFDLYYYGEL